MKTIRILPLCTGVAIACMGISSVAFARFPIEFQLLWSNVQFSTVPRPPVPAAEAPEGWPSWIGWDMKSSSQGTLSTPKEIVNRYTGEVKAQLQEGAWSDGWPSWIGR